MNESIQNSTKEYNKILDLELEDIFFFLETYGLLDKYII